MLGLILAYSIVCAVVRELLFEELSDNKLFVLVLLLYLAILLQLEIW